MKRNWEKGLILGVIVTVVFYLAIVLVAGADRFWASLDLIPPLAVPALAGLVMLSYTVRFLRWHWYLLHFGYSVPLWDSFRIFWAGFALSASPGKAGESIRSLLLERAYGIPIAPTLAALFCERFTDGLSAIFRIGLGLSFGVPSQWTLVAIVGVQVGLIILLQRPQLLDKLIFQPLGKIAQLENIARNLQRLLASAGQLLQPKILVGATAIALLSWTIEGSTLYFIFQFLRAYGISLNLAILIHTCASLLTIVSFLPGGIGTTEAAIVSLAMAYGITQTTAMTAAILVRLLTLWLPVTVGIFALLSCQRQGTARSLISSDASGDGERPEA